MSRENWGLLGLSLLAWLGAGVAFRLTEWLVVILFGSIGVFSGGLVLWRFFEGSEISKLVHTRREGRVAISRRWRWRLRHRLTLASELLFLLMLFAIFAFEVVTWRRDFSQEQLLNLSERSVSLLDSLNEDVTLLLFGLPTAWNELHELLKTYARTNDRITYRFVDLTRERDLAQRYAVSDEQTLIAMRGNGAGANPPNSPNVPNIPNTSTDPNTSPASNNILLRAEQADFFPLGQNIRQLQDPAGIPLAQRIDNMEGVINDMLITLTQDPSQAPPSLVFLETTSFRSQLSNHQGPGLSRLQYGMRRLGIEVKTVSLETIFASIDSNGGGRVSNASNASNVSNVSNATRNTDTGGGVELSTGGGVEPSKGGGVEPSKGGGAEASTRRLVLDSASSSLWGSRDIVFLFERDLLTMSKADLRRLVSPQSPLMAHLRAGGGMVMAASFRSTVSPATSADSSTLQVERRLHLDDWYAAFGMTPTQGVVVDNANFHPIITQQIFSEKGLATSELPFLTYSSPHPITELLQSERLTPFLISPETLRPLAPAETSASTTTSAATAAVSNLWRHTSLLRSGPRAWLEQNFSAELAAEGRVQFHFGEDEEGIHHVAWALTHTETDARMVFLGDDRFFENDFISLFGNRDLVFNAILWSGKNENLLGTTYVRRAQPLFLPSPAESRTFLIGFVILIPLAWLVLGMIMGWRHRRT